MAVTTTASTVDYTSNGSSTSYSVPFPFLDDDDLRVSTISPADVETVLTLGGDYTVTGGDPTGTVTMTVAITSGYVVRIARVLPLTQPVEFRAQGPFSPDTWEQALDRLQMQIQQLGDGEGAGFADLDDRVTDLENAIDVRLTVTAYTSEVTLALGDAGEYLRISSASAISVNVPADSSVAFLVGTVIHVRQVGAGQVTLVPATGVTLNTAASLKTRTQHSSVSLIKVGDDEWDVAGDLEAA